MKLAAAPMIIDILTSFCCVNGQGRESRTLSSPQRSQLSEIVSLSFQREMLSDSDDEDETDSCISEIVDAADECFTKTAIPLVRQEACSHKRKVSSRVHVAATVNSMRRQLVGRSFRECDMLAQYEQDDLSQRVLAAFETLCLRNRTSRHSLELHDNQLDWKSMWPAVPIAFTVVAITAVLLWREREYIKTLFRKESKKRKKQLCNCPICSGHLKLHETIGEGAFGVVRKCTSKDEVNVVKMIKVDISGSITEVNEAYEEAKHLIKYKHENVVEYRDVFLHRKANKRKANDPEAPEFQDYVCIVMEYCDLGTMDDVVQNDMLDFGGFIDAVDQMCAALCFLHANEAIHCDVKLENVLIKKSPVESGRDLLKVADFGLLTPLRSRSGASKKKVYYASRAKRMSGKRSLHGYASDVLGGTLAYQAPETFNKAPASLKKLKGGKNGVSTAVDVWGLACAMWEAVTRSDLPCDRPVLGERAIQSKDWQKQIEESLMPDFVEGLDYMIRAEIESEIGHKGIRELEYQLGVSKTPKIVQDSYNNNFWLALATNDADEEQREIRATVKSYLTAKKQVIELLPKMFRKVPTHRPLLKTVRALPLFKDKEPWMIFVLGDMEDDNESSMEDSTDSIPQISPIVLGKKQQ